MTCKTDSFGCCDFKKMAVVHVCSHVISSIGIVDARTAIPGIKTGMVEQVTYRGVQTYLADVHFTSDMLGQQPVCFVAQDDHGCVTISVYIPVVSLAQQMFRLKPDITSVNPFVSTSIWIYLG